MINSLQKIKTMKTLNLKKMKKPALGLIIALLISSTAIANHNKDFDNIIIEEEEMIVDWMTDLSSWKSLKASAFEVDMEEDLKLEKWMINLDSEVWDTDQEEELKMEHWMTNIAYNFSETVEMEEDLIVEDWMLDPSTWLN